MLKKSTKSIKNRLNAQKKSIKTNSKKQKIII